MKLQEIADAIGAQVHGDGEINIESIATIQSAQSGQIAFLANPKYRHHLEVTEASAVIVSEADIPFLQSAGLVMGNPYLGYAKVAQLLDSTPRSHTQGATISEKASVAQSAQIGVNTVIEAGAEIGEHVIIGPGCYIGHNTIIQANTRLWANVTVYHGVVIEEDCLIHAGAVIGADGFGFANDRGTWVKIPQLGGVIIHASTEIGANTTIDRGALDDTVIGRGVIIDNQCQIAHNVVIGDHTCIAGCTVVAGSTEIGKYCVIGGAVAISGHMKITDKVQITGMSMVIKSIEEPGIYSSGMPTSSNREWRKNAAALRNLNEMHKRLKKVEAQLDDE